MHAYASYIFYILAAILISVDAEIVFVRQPTDIVVEVGKQAIFPCKYNGSNDLAIWEINHLYYTTSFPPRHSRQGFDIVVDDVQEADNGGTYRCIVYDKISTIGTLTCGEGNPYSYIHCIYIFIF